MKRLLAALAALAVSCFGAEKPTLYLIGDSTVRNGQGDGGGGQWGWGEPLLDRFDSSKITVVNKALGGTSSKSYLDNGRWDAVVAALKPGDFVIMQFGHNDGGALDDKARARGTIRGVGEESKEIDNPVKGTHETVHTYGWYLRKYIAETRAKGATPIVCSLVPRMIWKDGRIQRDSANYAGWAREVAESGKVGFLDLNERIAAKYDALGVEKVKPLFADEHTHTTRAGAELNADTFVEALKDLPGNPLGEYLRAD